MPFSHLPRSALALGAVALLAGLPLVSLSSAARADSTHLTIATASPVARHVSLGLNKSMIIDLPANAREVIVSQPSIASATMRSQRRAILAGTGIGDTNIFFIDDAGRQIATLDVSVTPNDSALAETLARVLPGSNIHVEGFADRLVLSGTTLSQDDASKAAAIAAQFVNGATNVTSVITVSGPQQVNLKVTVAEVERSAVRQLGLDLAGSLTVGQLTTGLINPSTLGGASGSAAGTGNLMTGGGLPTGLPQAGGNSIGGGFSIPGLSLAATLHALEQRNLLRTLDEPTLTAMSGQSAELDAGGQVPQVIPATATTAAQVTYKNVGVDLKFTPTVKSDGMIDLVVDSSVSAIDNQFSFGGNPGFSNREAKTTVELPAGSTLSIGGLFEDQMRQEISSLPGIGNIPILGALFRSRDFIHDQTELVILVTPYLATPGAPPPLPTDGVVAAGDAESIFLGRMQKLYGVGDHNGHSGAYQGSVGFSLE
jgi:pilus assembly protein CpaC